MITEKFSGTGVAIITPFRNDGSIDFKSLGNLVEFQIMNGINYIVILGTTGENATLSQDEKGAVINFAADVVNKRVPLVAGIGGYNTQEVINHIKSADFSCIDAILSVCPYYNKPNQNGIYHHFKTITGVSPVPVIIYNVPGRTGANMTAETTVKLATEMKNIVAVKEASGNMQQIMEILRNKPDSFLVISGDDALTLPLISLGASGVISVAGNAFPKEVSQMVTLALKNDFAAARKIHNRLLEIIDNLFSEGSPAGIKAVLEILGLAQNNLRLPLTPVSQLTYEKLKKLTGELKKH